MIRDISYKDYRKKSDIHGTVLYPAVMVAPVQNDILKELIDTKHLVSIFDPFHGSGTSLYESAQISDNVRLTGCDINPLANLITKVKLQGVTNCITNDIEHLKNYILNDTIIDKYSFTNIDKWFRKDIADDLRIIRQSIMKIELKQNRLYFWYMLSDIVRKYSNTRSSTYKLHTKTETSISRIRNNVISDFIESIESNVDKFTNSFIDFCLFKCDILTKIKEFNDDSFDISITSPPYGDNATTVPYGQFSMLPLYWINKNDLEIEGWELDNYSKIDNHSLGGKNKDIVFAEFEIDLISPYIQEISFDKRKKVYNFFNDYFIFLKELCRVTNKYIVMTLGNRTVDGVEINLTDITMQYLQNYEFANIQLIGREIPNKRIPKKVSRVNNNSVQSINYEYVIIHENINAK